MTIQNRTTDLLVHIITYNIDIKHNSCSEFLCVIVIIIPSSPFSFKRYLLDHVGEPETIDEDGHPMTVPVLGLEEL